MTPTNEQERSVQSRAEVAASGLPSPDSGDAAHTPTPWKIYDKDDPYHIRILGRYEDIGNAHVADVLTEANAAFIVKAVNSYEAMTKRIARLEADLNECREYIEDHVDVVDGSYGEPAPNRAMQLVSMIDKTLAGH